MEWAQELPCTKGCWKPGTIAGSTIEEESSIYLSGDIVAKVYFSVNIFKFMAKHVISTEYFLFFLCLFYHQRVDDC